jgi:hypothetical protein
MLSCLAALAEGYSTLELVMNIEHEEVVVKDVSDDELEMAAGGTQGGNLIPTGAMCESTVHVSCW